MLILQSSVHNRYYKTFSGQLNILVLLSAGGNMHFTGARKWVKGSACDGEVPGPDNPLLTNDGKQSSDCGFNDLETLMVMSQLAAFPLLVEVHQWVLH